MDELKVGDPHPWNVLEYYSPKSGSHFYRAAHFKKQTVCDHRHQLETAAEKCADRLNRLEGS